MSDSSLRVNKIWARVVNLIRRLLVIEVLARPKPDQYQQQQTGGESSSAFRGDSDTDRFDHPRRVSRLTSALIRGSHSDSNIHAVLGGKFPRLLGATWT
jgi:hypothetical protein